VIRVSSGLIIQPKNNGRGHWNQEEGPNERRNSFPFFLGPQPSHMLEKSGKKDAPQQ
jgi:hypothetical protein